MNKLKIGLSFDDYNYELQTEPEEKSEKYNYVKYVTQLTTTQVVLVVTSISQHHMSQLITTSTSGSFAYKTVNACGTQNYSTIGSQ